MWSAAWPRERTEPREGSVCGRTQGGLLSRSRIEPEALPAFLGVISTEQQKERKRKRRKAGGRGDAIRVELSRA